MRSSFSQRARFEIAGCRYIVSFEPQINAIRHFWEHFMPIEGNDTKKSFKKHGRFCSSFIRIFAMPFTRGYAYEGMLFREVAERAKAMKICISVSKISYLWD